MPRRTRNQELTTSPPPPPPPADGPKPKLDTTRSLIEWELKENIEQLNSARERRARAARSAYVGRDKAAWDVESMADDTADAAIATITKCILLLLGRAERLEEIEAEGYAWEPCGVKVRGFQSDYVVWIDQYVSHEGQVSYDPGSANVTVADLAEVDDLAEKDDDDA